MCSPIQYPDLAAYALSSQSLLVYEVVLYPRSPDYCRCTPWVTLVTSICPLSESLFALTLTSTPCRYDDRGGVLSLSGNSTGTPTSARRHRHPRLTRNAPPQASVAYAYNNGPVLGLVAFIASRVGLDSISLVPLPPPKPVYGGHVNCSH